MLPTHHNMRQRGQPEKRLPLSPPLVKPTNSWEIDDHIVIGIDNGYRPNEHGSRHDGRTYQHEPPPTIPQHQKEQPQPTLYKQPTPKERPTNHHIQLDEFHTVFRRPHHVPDHQYASFLYGTQKPTTNYRTIGLQFCSVFAGIGCAFMLLVAILLDVQPLYIAGSLPLVQDVQGDSSSKSRPQYSLPLEKRLDICKTAYQTALLYLVVCGICIVLQHPSVLWQYGPKRRQYETLPDHYPPHFENQRQDWTLSKLIQGIRRYLTLRGYIRPRKRPGKKG